jgi:hypothetical protein
MKGFTAGGSDGAKELLASEKIKLDAAEKFTSIKGTMKAFIAKIAEFYGFSEISSMSTREIAFKKFSDNKMIMKYLEQGQ